jgi:hypothetical protein
MTSSIRVRVRLEKLGAAALYLLLALALFARGLIGRSGYFIGRGADPSVMMWFFNWWRFALAHRLNPLFTDWLWAPLGINLTWTTCVPLPSLASIPFQFALGEPATYNVMALLLVSAAAWSAFLLCYRITSRFWPSLLGGYVFGFSPYMLGQLLAHLVQFATFPIPLIALVVLKRLDDEISARRFVAWLTVLLTVEFLCSAELLATLTVAGGFGMAIALTVFDNETRERLLGLIAPAAIAYLLTAIVLSPYLYQMLAKDYPHAPIFPPDYFSADLLAFVVPTETNLFGTINAARRIAGGFSGDLYENGAYLGIVLIVFIEIFRRRFWTTSRGKFLILTLAVLIVAAMGSSLHIGSKPTLPLPWALLGSLPILSIALPERLMLYAFLIVGVMLAIWLASSSARLPAKCAAALVLLVSIAPNPHASFWVSQLTILPFFTDGTYASELKPREIILPLPWAQEGNSMYWQLRSGMYFRMAGGWTGRTPFAFDRMPVVNYFFGSIDLPEAPDQLKAYLARFDVGAVIADPDEPNFAEFKLTLDSLGITASWQGGVWLYKIPPGSFAAYAALPARQVEARAISLRFDAILEAAAKYLADGHNPSKLSAAELERFGLLPPDWGVNPKNIDWAVGNVSPDRVGIAVFGSYEGVKPLIDRYRALASEIDYPAPKRWTPQSSPPRDVLANLLIIFDRSQLASAAAQLKSSPPAEILTPFLSVGSMP